MKIRLPIKRGEGWKKTEEGREYREPVYGVRCSNCRNLIYRFVVRLFGECTYLKVPYCPLCGA